MLLRNCVLFLHLSGVMLFIGGVGASVACKAVSCRSESPTSVLVLLTTARIAIQAAAMPGLLLVVASGATLVARSHGYYSFSDPWIVGAIGLIIVSSLVGARIHGPRNRVARALAVQLEANGAPTSPELRAVLRGGRPTTYLDLALVGGIVALMVFKPGA